MSTRKNPKNTEILSPIQLKAIDLIMSGGKYTEIARSLNIPYDRLWRWTKNEIFSGELNRRKRLAIDASQTALINAATKAVETLISGLQSNDENIRVRSAQSILSRLPAIEPLPVTDWEVTMRQRAEELARGKEIEDNSGIQAILEDAGFFENRKKADRYHQELMDRAIDDLKDEPC